MYKCILTVKVKKALTLKETYEKSTLLIRKFISQNNKEMKKSHYKKTFSYYTFSNFYPIEKDQQYKEGYLYTIELKSINPEWKDLKSFVGLETDDLQLVNVIFTKMYYVPKGELLSRTPVYLHSKKIETPEYEQEIKNKIRENVVFRYLKSGINTCDDIEYLRKKVVKEIRLNPKVITIPFESKKTKGGNPILYPCIGVEITFEENDISKEVEKLIYATGIGLQTSCGFGYVE